MSDLARRRPLVLIVDDDPDFRRLVRQVVADEGLFAVEAADGQEALDVLPRARPGLITLDLDMPRMDGRQFLAALKGDHSTPAAHVFVITGRSAAETRLLGLPPKTVDRIFHKPLCLAELQPALRAVFHDEAVAAPATVRLTGTAFDA